MGVCSEALKRYLSDVDTPRSAPLLAAMPMGDEGLSDRKTRLHSGPPNNSLAVAIVPLHQDIADLGQRLQAIKRSSQAAIARMRRSYGRRFDNYLEGRPPAGQRPVPTLGVTATARGHPAARDRW
jgi:hypothetical protein